MRLAVHEWTVAFCVQDRHGDDRTEPVQRVEVVEFEELGMEAVWKIEVEDFPAFIVIDDKGNDFYGAMLKRPSPTIQIEV